MELLEKWRRTKYSSQINDDDYENEIIVAGWIQDIRNLGGIAFIQLRDREGIVQITILKKKNNELFNQLVSLPRESVIAVKGIVKENKNAKAGFEILPKEVKILSISKTPLPLGIIDKVSADLDTRLDNRHLDLRKPNIQAIFKIRSTILEGFRQQLLDEDFIEINTPKIVATATEGGTALFTVRYFENEAFLNQSPQLYKQMLMATGFDRVFEIAPAFRAEEHDTVRHLNEFISIDIEMAFCDEEDAMGVLERTIRNSFSLVLEKNKKELEILKIKPNIPEVPFPRMTYSKAVDIINSNDIDLEWGEDLSMEATKSIAKKFDDFYFITKWPMKIKPFYTQPTKENQKISKGFDLMYKEKEITSGAQRVHDVSLLKKRLREQNLNPVNFEFYLSAFEYGMPQHAGWGLGVERIVMIMTGMENIRECVIFPRDKKRLTP